MAADAGIVFGDVLTLAVAAFAHAGALRSALSALKYRGTARLARPLAEASVSVLRSLVHVSGPATLVPVPVHVVRRRERGYNQAELLGRELGRLLGMPVEPLIERHRPTEKQHRLDRAARLANLSEAFRWSPGSPHPPRTAVLVDDIVTTTATLEACAIVLRAAGVEAVYGFSIAREV